MSDSNQDWKFEDDLSTIDALLSSVSSTLVRVAIRGGISNDTRLQTRYKLQRAIEALDKLRAPPEKS